MQTETLSLIKKNKEFGMSFVDDSLCKKKVQDPIHLCL